MDPMTSPHVKNFYQALEKWTDQRFLSRDQLEALAMFSLYLVNILEARGWDYYGHSYKRGARLGCLVVKADREGTPHVVFTNARTYTGCVVAFLRRLQADAVDWRLDRYRQ